MQLVVNIKDHRLKLDCPISYPDGEYMVTIKRAHGQRSLGQLRYLQGVVYEMIAEHLTIDKEMVHEGMKALFLTEIAEYYKPDGSIGGIIVPRSLSNSGDVDTKEMTDYIEQVRAWASQELGLYIPDPS